jgi:hypothetical protein
MLSTRCGVIENFANVKVVITTPLPCYPDGDLPTDFL